MKPSDIVEKKLNNLLSAISKDFISKDNAYNQFLGYTKALYEFGIITEHEAETFRLRLAKVLY